MLSLKGLETTEEHDDENMDTEEDQSPLSPQVMKQIELAIQRTSSRQSPCTMSIGSVQNLSIHFSQSASEAPENAPIVPVPTRPEPLEGAIAKLLTSSVRIGTDPIVQGLFSQFMSWTDPTVQTETQVVPHLKTESTNPIRPRTRTTKIPAPTTHLAQIIAGLNLRPDVQACLDTYVLPRTMAESVQTVVPDKTDDDQNSKLTEENHSVPNPGMISRMAAARRQSTLLSKHLQARRYQLKSPSQLKETQSSTPQIPGCLPTNLAVGAIKDVLKLVVPGLTSATVSNSRRKSDEISETMSNEKVPRMSQSILQGAKNPGCCGSGDDDVDMPTATRPNEISETTTEPCSKPGGSGITLKNPKMFTWPNIKYLDRVATATSCCVTDFVVGHEDHGKVIFPGVTDVLNANLDEIFRFKNKGVTIYPVGTVKPEFGKGFNRPSKITLLEVWPAVEATKEDIRTGNKEEAAKFTAILENAVNTMKGKFVSYEPATGTWSFNLEGPSENQVQLH